MSRHPCDAPLGSDTLVAYWLGELDEHAQSGVEEHLFACAACSAALGDLATLAAGIRDAVRHGRVRSFVDRGFPQRLAAAGLRVREYRVPCNGSVHCTIAPDDDVMVARLEAALAGVARLDLELLDFGDVAVRLADVTFDPTSREVVFVPDIDTLRALPKSTKHMQLIAVDAGADRVLGEYAFHHTPWPGLQVP